MPFSRRPSLVRTQTCLLLVSGPLPQTLIHGEYISCGAAACGCAGAAAAGATGLAGAGFCAAGLVAGFGCCASVGLPATMATASNPVTNEAVSARPHGRPDAIR